jgi:hypothetical protein
MQRYLNRIEEEFGIIKEHRDRLIYKLASDFTEAPLLGLVESYLGQGNQAWKKMYNRECCQGSI